MPSAALPKNLLLARAHEILSRRQRRLRHFGKAMFGEPAWEMLLALYVEGARVPVTRLTELSGGTKATAIRWIEYLEKERLIKREPHPTDRRSLIVHLTDRGLATLEAYLSDTT